MNKLIDLTGMKFDRLKVIERIENIGNSTMWLCICDCNNIVVVSRGNLRNGHTKSCGCLRVEKSRERQTKHNLRKTRIYKIWSDMKQRCYNPNDSHYYLYGSRKIKVCKKWLDKENGFINFYNWAMANGYADNLTIDRIDNNKGYSPNNCRWVTMKEQQNNRRNNYLITYNNETNTMAGWERLLGFNESTLSNRITSNKWTIERAFTTPVRKRKLKSEKKSNE